MQHPEPILFVDDERDLWAVFEAQLREEIEAGHYRLLFSADGREALDLLENHPDVSIVVADIRMPELDGLDMLDAIRRRSRSEGRYARVQVIILTAYSDLHNVRQAIRAARSIFWSSPMMSRSCGALSSAFGPFCKTRWGGSFLSDTLRRS